MTYRNDPEPTVEKIESTFQKFKRNVCSSRVSIMIDRFLFRLSLGAFLGGVSILVGASNIKTIACFVIGVAISTILMLIPRMNLDDHRCGHASSGCRQCER